MSPRDRPVLLILRILIGIVFGTIAGALMTMAIVVSRARFRRLYLDSTDDIFGWLIAPVPVAIILGVACALAGMAVLARMLKGALAGGLAGMGVGVALGYLATAESVDLWAGGLIGTASGIIAGAALAISLYLMRKGDELRDSA